jgi:hypothetical protein
MSPLRNGRRARSHTNGSQSRGAIVDVDAVASRVVSSEGMGKQVPGHHAPFGLRFAAFLTWLLQLRDGEGGPGEKRVREEKDKELSWRPVGW